MQHITDQWLWTDDSLDMRLINFVVKLLRRAVDALALDNDERRDYLR